MRALVYNPGRLDLLTGLPARGLELEDVSAEALRAAAERLGGNDQLPILLGGVAGTALLPLLRALRQGGFSGPLILVVQQSLASEVVELLNAGADDVLALPLDARELMARVSAVSRRLRGITAEVVRLGDLEFYLDGRHPMLSGRELRLSAREYDILRHLMVNANHVVPKDSIYDALYALCAMPPFEKIIDVYICRLRAKMSKVLPGGGAYIETVPGRGYRVIRPEEMGLAY